MQAIRVGFLAIALAVLAGCGSSGKSVSPAIPSALASQIEHEKVSATPPPTTVSTSPPLEACSLLLQDDVLAVAKTFPDVTITIDDHLQSDNPPESKCGFNQKGTFRDPEGITVTGSGDQWAELTVVNGGADYAFDPRETNTISGLGDGAYWSEGSNELVIKAGTNVLQVVDVVPVNNNVNPDLKAVYKQAAQALAAKILSHM